MWATDTAAFAEAHDVLVFAADLGGLAGARADGELVELGWDDKHPKPIVSRRWRDLVLLSGRRFYQELEPLLPKRRASDLECASCRGTGKALGGELENVVCYCGGLGWIPSYWER